MLAWPPMAVPEQHPAAQGDSLVTRCLNGIIFALHDDIDIADGKHLVVIHGGRTNPGLQHNQTENECALTKIFLPRCSVTCLDARCHIYRFTVLAIMAPPLQRGGLESDCNKRHFPSR